MERCMRCSRHAFAEPSYSVSNSSSRSSRLSAACQLMRPTIRVKRNDWLKRMLSHAEEVMVIRRVTIAMSFTTATSCTPRSRISRAPRILGWKIESRARAMRCDAVKMTQSDEESDAAPATTYTAVKNGLCPSAYIDLPFSSSNESIDSPLTAPTAEPASSAACVLESARMPSSWLMRLFSISSNTLAFSICATCCSLSISF